MTTAVRWPRLLVLVGVILTGLAGPALSEKRVALVVGNSSYRHVPSLQNPANDARLMAETLQAVGFTLIGGGARFDLDKAGFDAAVQTFGQEMQGADVGLFYYAGHGVQVRGANYLVPIAANPTREADVDFQMLDVSLVLRQMDGAGTKLNLVILDACRNNPFGGRGLRASAGGLGQMQAPEGTLISFATQPGNVAKDGDDGNSPYTRALAQSIRRAGLGVFDTFNEVGLAVKRATGGAQQPWVSSSPIAGRFFFVPPAAAGVPPAAAGTPPLNEAALAWESVKDTTNQTLLEAFAARYADSFHATLARARLEDLRKRQAAVVPTPAVSPPPSAPKVSRAEVVKAFESFAPILQRVRTDYLDQPDEGRLLAGALDGVRKARDSGTRVTSVGPAPASREVTSGSATMDQIYDAAFTQLNESGSTLAAPALVNAAISGMLASLDPHSSYMDGKAFHDMQVQTRGEFGGVGMEVTMKDGLVQVVAPLEGTPAERAGILAGDLITLINESSVQGLSLTDAVTKLRGPVGSTVRVTITRAGQASPLIVPITRDIVRVRAVRSSIEGGDIGYIRITQFNEQTSDGLKKAIADVASQGGSRLRGIVLDLRNNPGGLLDQAVKVADEFLERGEIVSTRGRDPGDVQRFAAKAGDGLKGKPMVVLINGGSASGTEIVAAALQDHKRATVMGSRSFGKGTVQTIIPLGADKGALRLTTARYVSSTGRAIENGIQPDIEVLQDAPAGQKQDATAAGGKPGLQAYVPPDRKDDKALARAVDALRAVSSRAAPARR